MPKRDRTTGEQPTLPANGETTSPSEPRAKAPPRAMVYRARVFAMRQAAEAQEALARAVAAEREEDRELATRVYLSELRTTLYHVPADMLDGLAHRPDIIKVVPSEPGETL